MRAERATVADAAAIAALEAACFTDPWNLRMVEEELTNSAFTMLKLTENGELAAYAGFWSIGGDTAEIGTVCVSPPLRGRGLGRAVMQYALAEAKRMSLAFATLEVRESNAAALSLYRSLGFTDSGIRPHYYGDGENAVMMWLTL